MTHGSILMPYGHGSIAVPAMGELITHQGGTVIRDEAVAIEHALEHPLDSKPLSEIASPGERVAIIVNDITRLTRTGLFLQPIVRTLNRAGIPDHDIFIVFALGIHRPQTEAERRQIIGDELFSRICNFDHDAAAEANLVPLGRTRFGNTVAINRRVWEADRIILTGEIMYHLIAGYSGGRKSLVPGVAGWRTTTFNHQMIFHPNCRSGLLDGNPSHEDLLEACRMADPDFLVNVILSPEGNLLGVVAGHFDTAHRAGCKIVDQALSVSIDRPFDVLIASAGGSPLDIDIRQAHKGLENACRALKQDGSILFFAECASGSGHPAIERYAAHYHSASEMRQALENRFEVGGHKAWWLARLGEQFRVYFVSQLDPDFVRRFGFTPLQPENWAQHWPQFPGARIGIMPH
ncbi:MAG: nickel-dependent lactate racemase, partial [Acidobacteriaceae bacterium]|nr:nickel-dependent lactate racemase [Acidobacteriaceae bacterium]